jgi:nitroreductase
MYRGKRVRWAEMSHCSCVIDLLRSRRSIRKYEKRAIEERHLDILKEALLRCPSSRGIKPWTFIIVDDPELLRRLSGVKTYGSSFLGAAGLGIVVCGDETESDVWVEDCSIAAIVAHLTAHSLGLGSCWIQIRNRSHSNEKTAEKYVQELLGIPGHLRVEAIVAVGYPAESPNPVKKEGLEYAKIVHNGFKGRG